MSTLAAAYRRGTWRLRAPAETLAWIEPRLLQCGISRCADVSSLDVIGLPVYCAIRPTAAVLQVSNGKGISHESAKVSALMEAIEFHHCENPELQLLLHASMRALRDDRMAFIPPAVLAGYESPRFDTDQHVLEWVTGVDLLDQRPVMVPSSAVYFHRVPSLHLTTTNGLASGNHLVEATLHALYELIERDAAAELLGHERILIKEKCRVVDPESITDEDLAAVIARIAQSGSRLKLLQVASAIGVPTFWAILMDERSWISGSAFNTGWGTHVDPLVAAARAITEAVQSRVTLIHGAREDAQIKPVFRKSHEILGSKAFKYFWQLAADTPWSAVVDDEACAEANLDAVLANLLARLERAGHAPIVRCDLTKPGIDIPVVKLIAPSLRLRHG